MSHHIVVIGKTGQLAQALQKEIGLSSLTAHFTDRQTLDLTATETSLNSALKKLPACHAIILAAAYTAVDKAEDEQEKAMAVNGRAPGIIAAYCKEQGIPLVHISTDYVFNGQANEAYKETHQTDPINTYGLSKHAGEVAIKASGCRYAILRTSWVFDGRNKNFLTTMLKLAQMHKTVSVVNDQMGRPTYAGHLAQAVLKVTNELIANRKECLGIFNITNTGPVISWAEYAKAIFREQNLDIHVKEISSAEYPTPAKRPAYSTLDTTKFETLFASNLPSWQAGLKAALAERS